MTAICHCKDCQKQSGSALSVAVIATVSALTVTGTAKIFEKAGDSGQVVQRHFCPDCGSTVFSKPTSIPGIIVVRGGAFDDTRWIKPSHHIFCDSAQPWVQIPDDTANFPQMPAFGA
jgi:hypothetical protein